MAKGIALIAVFLFVSCVLAEDVVKWAGTTAGASTWAIPVFSGDTGACQAQGADPAPLAAPYVNFTVSYATDGIREVAAMAEHDFKDSIRVFIYTGTGFAPNAPCAGIYLLRSVAKELNTGGQGGGPVVDEPVFFSAGTYTFVVTSSEDTSGLFAVNIFPSIAVGSTGGASNPTWNPVNDDGDGNCITDSDLAPYATFFWTQATSGNFDVYATFANTSLSSFGTYAGLYQGSPSASGLQTDPCNTTVTGANILGWISGTFGAYLPNVWLTAGWNYTLVFSGDNGETGYYGVQVIPTRVRFFQNTPYTQPDRGADSCTPTDSESYMSASWDTTFFTAEQRAYLLDTAQPPAPYTYLDTYSWLYSGFNTAVPPTTCPLGSSIISSGDTGDVTPVFAVTDIGSNYTVVVSTYGGGQAGNTSNYAYVLYLFTGTPIGNIPASTTTGAAATTSVAAATTSVAAATTSTTGSTPATTSTTTTTGTPASTTTTTGTPPLATTTTGTKTNTTTGTPASTTTTTGNKTNTTTPTSTTAKAATASSSSTAAKSSTTTSSKTSTSSASSVFASFFYLGALLLTLF